MKNLIILISIIISNLAFGQQWCEWHTSYKFKLDNKSNVYEIVDIEFYINDPHYSLNSIRNNTKENVLVYDTINKVYNLNLTYGCISCGYERAKEPADIYLKISLKDFRIERPFSIFIPIYIKSRQEILSLIDLGTISLSEFVDGYTIGNNQEVLPPYEAMEVNTDNTINKLRNGEYRAKAMNKIVKLEVSMEGEYDIKSRSKIIKFDAKNEN